MENGESQHTFIRHFPLQDTVWYSETMSNKFDEPPSLTVCLTFCDNAPR